MVYELAVRDIPSTVRAEARRAIALDDATLAAACEETFFVGGGPGGQHRNKTASGVRLVHRATGVVVTATERRSQAQNRAAALARLRGRLAALAREPRPRKPTKATRGSKERRPAAQLAEHHPVAGLDAQRLGPRPLRHLERRASLGARARDRVTIGALRCHA